MSEPKLGELLEIEQPRDAIHFAVASVMAGEGLNPGEHVGLQDGRATSAAVHIGIVDPFLKSGVRKGQLFWLMLYPKTVTGMRHEWEHPAFGVTSKHVGSERWLRELAEGLGLSYDDLMHGTATWVKYGDYMSRGPLLEGAELPDEFWSHYEQVMGSVVAEGKKQNFFSCSC